MRNSIKLLIKQRRPFGHDWVRFYDVDKILIDDSSILKTEGQLCYYIYKKFGVGRYQILAWQKGHEGFWMYWLGDIMENGFIRDIRKNKELDNLKGEFHSAKTFEEKRNVEEMIDVEREIGEITKTIKRKGPIGIKPYRPGIMYPYEEF